MIKKIIKNYYKLLDEKLHNWTFVVIIIAFFIISIWDLTNKNIHQNYYLKANIQEAQNTIEYIEINWKTYKLVN